MLPMNKSDTVSPAIAWWRRLYGKCCCQMHGDALSIVCLCAFHLQLTRLHSTICACFQRRVYISVYTSFCLNVMRRWLCVCVCVCVCVWSRHGQAQSVILNVIRHRGKADKRTRTHARPKVNEPSALCVLCFQWRRLCDVCAAPPLFAALRGKQVNCRDSGWDTWEFVSPFRFGITLFARKK